LKLYLLSIPTGPIQAPTFACARSERSNKKKETDKSPPRSLCFVAKVLCRNLCVELFFVVPKAKFFLKIFSLFSSKKKKKKNKHVSPFRVSGEGRATVEEKDDEGGEERKEETARDGRRRRGRERRRRGQRIKEEEEEEEEK
jgi:hypothetical protein